LIKKLNAGRYGKLTLVSAPAGFGKTTLVGDWLRSANLPVAWLTIDEADNDPACFLAYFLAALGKIEPHIGKATGELLQLPEPPAPDLLMATLLNEITAISGPFILAIDDLQLIQSRAVLQQLSFIVERQPEHMHLVILTREDPALPLPRLRARGQMTEIRQDDLRFSEQECAEFLGKVMGIKVSPSDVATLERRTEGWIAGLQLAALAMQTTLTGAGHIEMEDFVKAFAGSNRYILDYLMEEVFERQTADVRDFLLKTSILDRLCGPLCDQVVERSASQALLQKLEGANLFIVPLDQSRNWYRYHRLFADLLRQRLRLQNKDLIVSLHNRAARWYTRQGLLIEAFPHALAAEEWDELENLVHSVSSDILSRGQIVTMLNWLDGIPAKVLLKRPRLCFDFCWPLILSGQHEKATNYLKRIEPLIGDDRTFLGELATAQAYLARAQGENKRMVELSHRALSLLPKEDLLNRGIVAISLGIAYWHIGDMDEAEKALDEAFTVAQKSANQYARLSALTFQGRVLAVRGRLHLAAEKFMDVIQDGAQIPISALAYLDLSCLAYEWNDLPESARYLDEMKRNCQRNRNNEFLVVAYMMEARLKIAVNNLQAAGDALEMAQKLLQEGGFSGPTPARLAAAQVQFALAGDDLDDALYWAGQLDDHADCHNFHRFFNLTRAKLLLAQEKRAAARQHLELCYKAAVRQNWRYGQIAILAMQALTASSLDESYELLEQALVMAQPEGIIRTFVDVGPGLGLFLQEAARRGTEPEYVGKILAVLKGGPQEFMAGQSILVEPLSGREVEVLRLVAAGLSNREIGEKLIISMGTAKTHVHNLCGKLGVRNRIEAAKRGRELGLL
ncbi:LuxR C-terminal-related transcriptional regulator, partial [Chloroflexota bacterium]